MLDPDKNSADPAAVFDAIGVIALEMRLRFGDDAADVARRQLDAAIDGTAVRWEEILARLGG